MRELHGRPSSHGAETVKRCRIRDCERGEHCSAITVEEAAGDPRPIRGWSCHCGRGNSVEFFSGQAPTYPPEIVFEKEAR